MFLLVSVRHVGAHPDRHQRGVSIHISIYLGKTFLRVSRIRLYSSHLNLGEGLCIFTSFHFQDSGLYLFNGFDFILIDFEWRDTKNQKKLILSALVLVVSSLSINYQIKSRQNIISLYEMNMQLEE